MQLKLQKQKPGQPAESVGVQATRQLAAYAAVHGHAQAVVVTRPVASNSRDGS